MLPCVLVVVREGDLRAGVDMSDVVEQARALTATTTAQTPATPNAGVERGDREAGGDQSPEQQGVRACVWYNACTQT